MNADVQLEKALAERDEAREELALNAKMLARQCDLARQAEADLVATRTALAQMTQERDQLQDDINHNYTIFVRDPKVDAELEAERAAHARTREALAQVQAMVRDPNPDERQTYEAIGRILDAALVPDTP